MIYANREMKVDQLIGYFNAGKISLIPPFQRGSVWRLPMRQRLIANMVNRRPIPAIFLYKDPDGSMFAYNILDGKQRLESLILFVGDKHPDLKVEKLKDYFFGTNAPKKNFEVEIDGKMVSFAKLGEEHVRAFREYAIPTIEIDMDDDRAASLDELTQLFADINTYGVRVDRFHVVKAIQKDPLIKSVFELLALEQTRRKAKFYRMQDNSFTRVLKQLMIVSRLRDPNARVDRMWERLVEIVLFVRTGRHRAPAQVLGVFLKGKQKGETNEKLKKEELASLRKTFLFLAQAYAAKPALKQSKLATDQPQFYTLITTLLSTNIMERHDAKELTRRLVEVGNLIETGKSPLLDEYRELSVRTTTHPSRRTRRQAILTGLIDGV